MRIATIGLAVTLALGSGAAVQGGTELPFTEEFGLEACRFSDRGRNPYFSLEPGDQLVLTGEDDGEELVVEITVLHGRRWVSFETASGVELHLRTRIVEEREWVDDELVEVSRNYFARCVETNAIYYFGEEVDLYEDGEIIGHEGAWEAGVDGARPGLIMPGTFLLGSRYFQEIAPDLALDRAENVSMGLEVEVAAGTFDHCVEVHESSPLEPGSVSVKRYCPGIGLVYDDGVELVERDTAPSHSGRWRPRDDDDD